VPLLTSDQEAAAIVAEELGRTTLGVVIGDRVSLYTEDTGSVELPLLPVRSITSVQIAGAPVTYQRTGNALTDLPLFAWVDVVYDHGWADGEEPEIVLAIQGRLSRRITENPTGVQRETIGGRTGYTADYAEDATALSASEKRALRRWSSKRIASSIYTRTPRPADQPVIYQGW